MRLIKLNAIGSTNDYLKELMQKEQPENFTVVTAENQTDGRGQMGATWVSEEGSNLIMSVLIRNEINDLSRFFELNVCVALAVYNAIGYYGIPEISIKWPNDIMSGKKKIAGILIENSVKSADDISSVVGIGVNVNQINFAGLPRASSMAVEMSARFDKLELLDRILNELVSTLDNFRKSGKSTWSLYESMLFKKDVPMAFENAQGLKFMGIIKGVAMDGRLQILLEDDSVANFNLKEVAMLY